MVEEKNHKNEVKQEIKINRNSTYLRIEFFTIDKL